MEMKKEQAKRYVIVGGVAGGARGGAPEVDEAAVARTDALQELGDVASGAVCHGSSVPQGCDTNPQGCARGRGEVGVEACRVWTSAVRVGHNGGEPPGWARMAPLAGGSAEPPAEGIHKDTNGPDQASDADQHGAHLPGRILVLTDLDVPAPGLGHGPHLLSGSPSSPARTLSVRGEGAEEGPTSMPRRPPAHRLAAVRGARRVRWVAGGGAGRRPDGARRAMSSVAGQAVRL